MGRRSPVAHDDAEDRIGWRSLRAVFGAVPTSIVADQRLGGLANLPIAVRQRSLQRGVDLRPVERGEGDDGSAPHRRLVGRAVQDRRQAPLVADRAERCHCRFPHERLLMTRPELDQPGQRRVVHVLVLAARPRRHLDHERVGVRQQGQQRDGTMGGGDLGRSTADHGRRIGEGGGEGFIAQLVQPFQCAERGCSHRRVVRGQPGTGARFVAAMTCERDVPPCGHDKRPLSVVKRKIRTPATAVAVSTPSTIPIAGKPTSAASRSHHRGGR